MKVIATTLKNAQQEGLVWWFMIALVLLCSLYLYYVNDAVRNVVLRERAERDSSEITSRLGELEFEHRKLSDAITLSYASSLGFVEVATPLFASRDGAVSAVSFNRPQ